MSSLVGFVSRGHDRTKPSLASTPSVMDTSRARYPEGFATGGPEGGLHAGSDPGSAEKAAGARADAAAPSVDERYGQGVPSVTHTPGATLQWSARTDTTDALELQRHSVKVSSASSTSVTAKSMPLCAPIATAQQKPLVYLTDVAAAPSAPLSSSARRRQILLGVVGVGVLGLRLLGHPSGVAITVFGVILGSLGHIARMVLNRDWELRSMRRRLAVRETAHP